MCRPTTGGQRVLRRAADLGAVTMALPSPREAGFGILVRQFLRATRPDVFHCHVGIGWEGWGNLETARRAGVPVIMQTQHLPFLLGNPHKRRGLLKALKEADCVIAVSDGVRRTYEAIGVPSERLITVPNGVARCEAGAGRNAIRAGLGLGIDQPVVMTVGRLTQMKAQRNLIDAIPYLRSRVPDVAVVIVGDGPLRRQLEDQAASLGVGGATHFLGHRIDARSLLEAADVFVLPSRHEGMPLAAIEAMAAGLPLVATRVLGSREVVEDGKTGTLVPRDDPSALGPAVADLLTDEDRRKTYGAAGLRRYLESFTAQRMAARTHALYEHFLADACRVVDRPHIQP